MKDLTGFERMIKRCPVRLRECRVNTNAGRSWNETEGSKVHVI